MSFYWIFTFIIFFIYSFSVGLSRAASRTSQLIIQCTLILLRLLSLWIFRRFSYFGLTLVVYQPRQSTQCYWIFIFSYLSYNSIVVVFKDSQNSIFHSFLVVFERCIKTKKDSIFTDIWRTRENIVNCILENLSPLS